MGGVATSGLMSHWTGSTEHIGIYGEILRRAQDGEDPHLINPEKLKLALLEMLREAGVRYRLYTFASDVIVEDGVIHGIITETKSGREAILARIVVDATGDGDIAAKAGVPFTKGRAATARCSR